MTNWVVSRIRANSAQSLGVVSATTEKEAIRKAVKRFKVPIEQRRWLVARKLVTSTTHPEDDAPQRPAHDAGQLPYAG